VPKPNRTLQSLLPCFLWLGANPWDGEGKRSREKLRRPAVALPVSFSSGEPCLRGEPSSLPDCALGNAELPNNGLKPQTDTQQVTFRAKFLRVIIASGYEHFAALSKVAAISGDGAAASEPVLDESRDSEESNEPEDSF